MKSGEISFALVAGKSLPLRAGVSLSVAHALPTSDQPQFSAIQIDVTNNESALSPFTVLPSRINTPPCCTVSLIVADLRHSQ